MNEIVGILGSCCFFLSFLKKNLDLSSLKLKGCDQRIQRNWRKMGNIESVDGQSEMKHHIMPLKVPMPDPNELEEKFAIVLVSF